MSSEILKADSNPFLGGHYLNLAKMNLMPPAERYVSASDKFYIAIWNAVTNLAVTLKGRMLLKNGSISEITRRFEPTNDRVINEYYMETTSGFLLDLEIFPEGPTKRGQTFVHVSLYQNNNNSNNRNALLIQNYLQSGNALSFPRSKIQDSIEGKGVIRLVSGTDPAAGEEVLETVPTNAKWKILAVRFFLTTDATVANRQPALMIDDGSNEIHRSIYHNAQTASLVRSYFFNLGSTFTAAVNNSWHLNNLPELELPAGARIRSVTSGIQAGDDFAAPNILVEEWIEEL